MKIYSVVNTDGEIDDLMGTFETITDAQNVIDLMCKGIDSWRYNGDCGLRIVETDTQNNNAFIYHWIQAP